MEQNQALQILVNAAELAQSKGAFNLQEAAEVAVAISVFQKPPAPTPKPKEEIPGVVEEVKAEIKKDKKKKK